MMKEFVCQRCGVQFFDTEKHGRRYCSVSCRYSDPAEIERMRKRRKGIFHTEETKRKMRAWQSKRPPASEETKRRRSVSKRSIPNPWMKGEKNPSWKGGITPERNRIRSSMEYREWVRQVFERDNFTCRKCGKRGGNLNADHIKSFALFPSLRFELSNGQTLCVPCHKIKTWGKPTVIIAHTVKGKGVSFMENNNLYHYKQLNKEEYEKALTELHG